ncbi:DUF2809 domain-containing protein [Flavobacterium psychrotrophum]|uniref:ribosomal maturation YjgA family protein n=1 Tax=Flavobacterium psychrotrophum TaxID=2294119 RepID=UPI000E3227A5|nr:DUF2809 domain-containing protein [Flavobacterium psychrotrophum]
MKQINRFSLVYFIIVLSVIALGLFVRIKAALFPDIINLYLGDALYAVMMFYIYSTLLPLKKSASRAMLALLTCYCIELSQLCNAPYINAIRATLPGRLILGQGFLWSDILAYSIGVSVALGIDMFWRSRTKISG